MAQLSSDLFRAIMDVEGRSPLGEFVSGASKIPMQYLDARREAELMQMRRDEEARAKAAEERTGTEFGWKKDAEARLSAPVSANFPPALVQELEKQYPGIGAQPTRMLAQAFASKQSLQETGPRGVNVVTPTGINKLGQVGPQDINYLESRIEGQPAKVSAADKTFQDFATEMQINLNEAIQNYSDKYVGWADSKLTNWRQRTGRGASEQAGTFNSAVSGLRNVIFKARSGGAITPNEEARLVEELPSTPMGEVDFKAKMEKFQRVFNALVANRGIPQFQVSQGFAPQAQPAAPTVPSVGQTFNGEKVLKVTRIQ